MFEDAKVGDSVWSMCYGWGRVNGIDSFGALFSVCVLFTDGHSTAYTVEGRDYLHNKNTLFWDEVKITPPPRPKKEIEVEGWVNLYAPSEVIGEGYICSSSGIFETQELADQAKGKGRLGEAVHIKHKYKV